MKFRKTPPQQGRVYRIEYPIHAYALVLELPKIKDGHYKVLITQPLDCDKRTHRDFYNTNQYIYLFDFDGFERKS